MGSLGSADNEWKYPDFLLADQPVTGVQGGKKQKREKSKL